MMKFSKIVVSLLVVMAMLMSIMPLGVFAGEAQTIKIPFSVSNSYENADRVDFGYVRKDRPTQWFQKSAYTGSASTGDLYYGWYLTPTYLAFAQMDLSGYEEILRNEGTTVSMNLVRRGNSADYSIADYSVFFAPDNCDFIDFSSDETMNYSVASNSGFLSVNLPFYSKADGELVSSHTSGNLPADSVIAALNQNPANSKVSLYFRGDKSSSARVAVSGSSTYFAINYDPDKIDNQDYVNGIAEEMPWSYVSEQDINSVETNLTLPTKYNGADITWTSSDNSAISPDGTVTKGVTPKTVTLTATLSYKGIDESAAAATATKSFDVTVDNVDPVTVNVPFESYGNWRSDKSDQKGNPSTNSDGLKYINTGNGWVAHASMDLSAYEEILRNPNTTVTATITTGNGYGSGECYDFKFLALPDSYDAYDAKKLTYTEAKNLGWWNTEGREAVIERTETTLLSGTKARTFDVNKQALLNALNESYVNGKLSFGIVTDSSKTSSFAMGKSDNYITISYYPIEADDNAFFEENKENLIWENLTDDAIDNVEKNLPTYFRGGQISWASANGHVFADGTVYGSKTEKLSEKITATYTYAGNTYTKDFDVTLAVYLPVVITVKGSSNYATYIDSASPNTAVGVYEKAYDQFLTENMGVFEYDEDGNVKKERMTFMKWNLTGYEPILDAATDVAVVWSNKPGGYTTSRPSFALTVMNNVNDSWSNSTLTYNTAVETGMRTDPGVFTVNNVVLEKEMKITAPGLLQAFKDALAQNPENSIVSAKITGKTWNQFHIRSDSRTYDLEISYYPRDVKAQADYAAEQFDAMTWDAVSMQNSETVVAGLNLPAKVYGSNITWSSSDEGVIVSSSGEVIIGDTAKTVDLTASLGNKTKTFTVTVPASNVITNSTQMNSKGIISNIDVTTGFVYANADIEGTPDVIVATYKDGTLQSVRVHNDTVIKSGATCFYSNVYGEALKGAQTKILVVDDIETLKPLGIAR